MSSPGPREAPSGVRTPGSGLAVCLLGCLLGVAPAAAVEVAFASPAPGQAVFGAVVVEVQVAPGAPAPSVRLSVDGRVVGELQAPPYRFEVDVGDDNREHRFEAIARIAGREAGRALLVTPAIRVDDRVEIDLQQIYVTVVDGAGRRVTDLPRSAFRLFDDGEEQRLVTFSGGDVPFTAVLMIDVSGSMAGERLEVALEGARAFIDGLARFDEAKLVAFSDRVRWATPFSGMAQDLSPALEAASAREGTAVLDHLYLALAELERRQGRRVVVLLSDGWDLHSVIEPADLERLARASQAMVYWVRLDIDGADDRRAVDLSGEPRVLRLPLSTWRNPKQFNRLRRTLTSVVERSGGRVDVIGGVDEVAGSFRDILRELREQYALGYYPDPKREDGAWRRVRVDLEGGDLRPRLREGYLDRRP